MPGPQNPPLSSFPVSPILAKLPIGTIDPNDPTHVLPTVQFLKMYQQLWASIAGADGIFIDVSILSQEAIAPPYGYSDPAGEALYASLARLQVPGDPAPPIGYPPYLPESTDSASQLYTPTVTYATPGDLTVAYTAQQGQYRLAGNLVCFNANVSFTPTFTTASGAIVISAPIKSGPVVGAGVLSCDPGTVTWPASRTMVTASIALGSQGFTLNALGSGVAASALGAAHYLTGVAYTIQISGCYFKG